MGCASSVNVQIEENHDKRKILANGKEVGNIKKTNDDKSEEKIDEDHLDIPIIKQTKEEENSESKTILNTNKILNKQNIKINDNQ